MRLLSCGVANQNIQAAKLGDRIGHEFLAKTFVAQIAGKRDGIAPCIFDEGDHFVRIGLLGWKIIDCNISTSRAKAMAAARPIPESPPVINAFRPSNRPEPL